MFELLNKINQRPKPFEFYTAETLWNDEYISKKMLEYHLNEDIEPASRNKAFMDQSLNWIQKRFNVGDNIRIGDFGCGPGLYSNRLAEIGGRVTGIDFSTRSINYAKETARKKNLDIEYVNRNYLEYDSDHKFDLILLIYCDLCPLSPEQRKTLLGIFHKHLADGGLVLLDVFSMEAYRKREEISTYAHLLMDRFWSENDYYGFMNTFKYDDEKAILDKYTIIEKTRTWEVYNWLQYFSLESLTNEFEQNRFEIVEHYSDVAGTSYSSGSQEIAVIARRIP